MIMTDEILDKEYTLIKMNVIVYPEDEGAVLAQFSEIMITNSKTDYGVIAHTTTSEKVKMKKTNKVR